MRKLKLQMQLSVDGFVGGPNGELDWMTWEWDEELKQFTTDLHKDIDCILIGRKVALEFIPYWAKVAANPEDPEHSFGILMTETPKVVFSRTMKTSEWDNTTIANNPVEEVARLKKLPGKDIIIYGGAELVSHFIKHDLIDEYNFFVNPTAIGKGLSIFREIQAKFQFKLESATPFSSGLVVLKYVPASKANKAVNQLQSEIAVV